MPQPRAPGGYDAMPQSPGGYITGRQYDVPRDGTPVPRGAGYPPDYVSPGEVPYSGMQTDVGSESGTWGAPPSSPFTPPSPSPGVPPGTPIPYSGPPGDMPYSGMKRELDYESGAWGAPSPPRPFPKTLVIIIIIAIVGLLGFAAYSAGWVEGPINAVQGFAAGIKWPPSLSLFHTDKDTMPPAIQNTSISNITKTGAVVAWKTDEPATSQVMYCESEKQCLYTSLDKNLVTDHSLILSDLKPGTTYHITAVSKDSSGNEATSDLQGVLVTLTDAGAAILKISGVSVSNTTELSATISWATDSPATSQVEYGMTTAYGSSTLLDKGLVTSHSVILTGLAPNTMYHFRVRSKDSSGQETMSEADQTFTTRSAISVGVEEGAEVGKRAPDFTLDTVNGGKVSLSDFRGKIVMVKFWVDNPTTRTEMVRIQSFYKNWSGKELVILAVNWKQALKEVQNFVKDKGLTFTVLLDTRGEVAAKYGASPSYQTTTFFIDAEGIIKERKDFPFRSEAEIGSMLESL